MRTIKFRIFNKKIKSYIDIHSSAIMIDELNNLNDNLIVEQFTGLHDKNGKEIYEGDILIHKTDGQFTIVWDNCFLCFAAKTEGSNAVDYIHSSYFIQCEIIGNIYENA